jgi:hypothetical protein
MENTERAKALSEKTKQKEEEFFWNKIENSAIDHHRWRLG